MSTLALHEKCLPALLASPENTQHPHCTLREGQPCRGWLLLDDGLLPFQDDGSVCVSCSIMPDPATPWIAARHAPLPTGFSRQEYWRGLLFPYLLSLPHWQAGSFTTSAIHNQRVKQKLEHTSEVRQVSREHEGTDRKTPGPRSRSDLTGPPCLSLPSSARGWLYLAGWFSRSKVVMEVKTACWSHLAAPRELPSDLLSALLFIIISYLKIINLFLVVWGLCCCVGCSLVVAIGGCSPVAVRGMLFAVASPLQSTGSVTVAPGLSCLAACGIFPDQGSHPCVLNWQVDSSPLSHQGSSSPLIFLIVDLQCCVNFCRIVKWFNYTYMCVYLYILLK